MYTLNVLEGIQSVMCFKFKHVQCSRRFRLVTCTLPSYQPIVSGNFLLPVSPEPLRIKRFYHLSQGNKGQPMPCQDPTYLSMPWRSTWDREDPKKLYTTSNHEPWNVQPKACALQMLEWCKEATIGKIGSKGLNTPAYHLTLPSVQAKLTNTSKTFSV